MDREGCEYSELATGRNLAEWLLEDALTNFAAQKMLPLMTILLRNLVGLSLMNTLRSNVWGRGYVDCVARSVDAVENFASRKSLSLVRTFCLRQKMLRSGGPDGI